MAVIGSTNLPIASRDRQWDGSAAERRVFAACMSGDDVSVDCVSRAFLWRDPDADPETQAAYKLGFADIVNGRLTIIPRGVAATAGGRGVNAADIPSADKARIRTRICTLYDQIREQIEDWPPCPFEGSNSAMSREPVSLTFDGDVDVEFRVDRPRRLISGLVLPWGQVASDSRGLGRWRFQRGSLRFSRVSRVKLLRDHDIGQPTGVAVSLENASRGLQGAFRVRRGPEGDEVLDLAEDGILDGFSAGAVIEPNGWEIDSQDRGVRLVTDARLPEVTVTAIPAFDDARVEKVAASIWLPKGAEMARKNDDDKPDEGDGGGTTVLDDEDSAIERFRGELDTRFEAMTDKIAETQEKQSEAVTKIITDAFEAAFKSLEGPQTGHRAEMAGARLKVMREEPVYRFDGNVRAPSMVRDFWRANTEREQDAIERLRKFQAQQRDMVDLLAKFPPHVRQQFQVSTANAGDVIPPGFRPDLFVTELRQGRPIVAQASRGTITDATPFTVPRFVSSSGATADHVEGTNPTPGTLSLDSVTVSPGAVSGRFELTREIVDASNPAIDAIALAAMRESFNQQTEVKAYAELNVDANVGFSTDQSLTSATFDKDVVDTSRDLLARYPFTRFAAPTGAVMGQRVTRGFANAQDSSGRPLLPSIGAQNTSGIGNAVDQGWFVDGLPFVPAWAITENVGDELLAITSRSDWWVWESPLLTFRFEEKSGPALIEMNLFAYFATRVLRPAGVFTIRAIA